MTTSVTSKDALALTAMLASALVGTACESEPQPKRRDQPSASPTDTPSKLGAAPSSPSAPQVELARLDGRAPVPLQPMMAWHQKQNMMDHLLVIQEILGALSKDDWAGVASASARIEVSPQMQQMCEHMGAGAPGFTTMALEFHRRAKAIGTAAQAKDATAVLGATSETLKACTGCHAVYRQEVVDAATWQSRTGKTMESGTHQHGGH